MAKDPRFNFYPDNWSGGTKRMNFEQKGAYMELIMLNFYCFSDGLKGFTEQDAMKSLASATACAELWNFLKPKFKTDGEFFWSERMQKEFKKAQIHSKKQSERAAKRWNNDSANAVALPDNGIGYGIGTGNEIKGVQGENDKAEFSDYERWTEDIIADKDWLFNDKLRNMGIRPNGQLADFARSHLALLAKYPKMQPTDQNRFRISLIGHIQEKLKDNGTINTNKTASTDARPKEFSGADYSTGLRKRSPNP